MLELCPHNESEDERQSENGGHCPEIERPVYAFVVALKEGMIRRILSRAVMNSDFHALSLGVCLGPVEGVEPPTYYLQDSCSAN